jgi:hypothetical protein
MKFNLKPIQIGAVAGVAVSLLLLGWVASGIAGVSESVVLAQIFFPYAAYVSPDTQAWIIPTVLFVQYPFYGGLLGFAYSQLRYRWLILIPLLALLFCAHLYTFRAARRADAIWVASQGGE